MTDEQKKQLAASLINTTTTPPELTGIKARSVEARAYHKLEPYPLHHFRDWKTEDRGPLPRCMPIARSIVKRGARWLFGKPIQILVTDNETLEKELRRAWKKNGMAAKMVALAEDAALDGGYVLKFSYEGAGKKTSIRFQSLSIVDQVRLYYNPHDCDELLMARVQYSYYDAAAKATMWYREEWTAEEEVHYLPVKQSEMGNAGDPDTHTGWSRDPNTSQPNPFKVIPLLAVKNIETAQTWGTGDLWDLYRVLDRVHLTRHLMDRSNQFDSEINPIFIDLELDDDDIDKPIAPGQGQDLKSAHDKDGKVILPEARGSLRPAMRDYVKDLIAEIRSACGSVEIDQAEITNVGNMTVAVLRQVYQAQIEITDEKRKSQGDGGVAAFLSLAARGLQNAGVPLSVTETDEESYDVQVRFPDYFDLSEDEKTVKVARLQEEELAGYVTRERAVEEAAAIEGRDDVSALKDELKKEPKPSPTENVDLSPRKDLRTKDAPIVK